MFLVNVAISNVPMPSNNKESPYWPCLFAEKLTKHEKDRNSALLHATNFLWNLCGYHRPIQQKLFSHWRIFLIYWEIIATYAGTSIQVLLQKKDTFETQIKVQTLWLTLFKEGYMLSHIWQTSCSINLLKTSFLYYIPFLRVTKFVMIYRDLESRGNFWILDQSR